MQLAGDRMATRRTEIGQFIFEHESGELHAPGSTNRLSPKAAGVLTELIDAGGEIVSREALHDSVWANQFVTDAQISKAITELRQAFGDSACNSQYIETLPKRGYRVLASLSDLSEAESEKTPSRPSSPGLLATIAAVCLFGIAVTFIFIAAPDYSDSAETPSEPAPSISVSDFGAANEEASEWAIAAAEDLRTALAASNLTLVSEDADYRYVLSGQVRVADDVAVITIELLDRGSGEALWRKRLSQPRDNGVIFEKAPFVSFMVQRVVSLESMRQQYAHTSEAVDAFIRSILEYLEWSLGAGGNFRVAESHALKALEHDSEFAPAHRILALWYAMRLGNALTAEDALPLAHKHVRAWLQFEPTDTFPLALINRLLDLDYRSALLNIAYLERHPTPVDSPASLAAQRCQIRLATGELPLAESACLEALAYGDGAPAEILQLLARISRIRGDSEAALRYLREAAQHESGRSVGTLEGAIVAARLSGETSQLDRAIDELLETPGVRPEAYMQFIAMAGRTGLAARLAEEAEDGLRGREPHNVWPAVLHAQSAG